MGLREVGEALSSTALSQAIQSTSWAIPLIQTVHIAALGVLFGSALVLCLRIFGRGMVEDRLAVLARRLISAIWISLAVLLISGTLLIVSEPSRTLGNPSFYSKMVMLAVAVAITFWIQKGARASAERVPLSYRVGAVLSVVLWAGIMVAGRYIAYVASY